MRIPVLVTAVLFSLAGGFVGGIWGVSIYQEMTYVGGQVSGGRMRVKLLRVEDEGGREYGRLVLALGKYPTLEFYDQSGTARIGMQFAEASARLSFYERRGREVARLFAIDEPGSAPNVRGVPILGATGQLREWGMQLFDLEGAVRSEFIMRNEEPIIAVYNKSGQEVWRAPRTPADGK